MGGFAAAVTRDGDATVWDVESRSLSEQFWADVSQATGVSFSSDGTMLATAGTEGVRRDGNRRHRAAASEKASPPPTFQPDCSTAAPTASTGKDCTTSEGVARGERESQRQIWNVAERSRIATLQVNAGVPGPGRSPRLHPRLQSRRPHARVAGDDPLVHLFMFAPAGSFASSSRTWAVPGLEFSPDGRTLAILGKPRIALGRCDYTR